MYEKLRYAKGVRHYAAIIAYFTGFVKTQTDMKPRAERFAEIRKSPFTFFRLCAIIDVFDNPVWNM